jgi:hypothetical protein
MTLLLLLFVLFCKFHVHNFKPSILYQSHDFGIRTRETIVVGRFMGNGMDIPYNTLLAAKARQAEKES